MKTIVLCGISTSIGVVNLGVSPVLARWLAVLRMQQVKEAKSRG